MTPEECGVAATKLENDQPWILDYAKKAVGFDGHPLDFMRDMPEELRTIWRSYTALRFLAGKSVWDG